MPEQKFGLVRMRNRKMNFIEPSYIYLCVFFESVKDWVRGRARTETPEERKFRRHLAFRGFLYFLEILFVVVIGIFIFMYEFVLS